MPRSEEEAYRPALDKASQDMQQLDPYIAAFRSACDFRAGAQGGQFELRYFGDDYVLQFPRIAVQDAAGKQPDVTTRLILLHYLIRADGAPLADQWSAYREMPDGRIYDLAFQRRASLRLARAYGADAAGFSAASQALGGERLSFGNASYLFRVLSRVPMAVVLYLGDEEFGPAVNVLFDASAGHYLPTEDLAVLGSVLAGRLIKARPTQRATGAR